MTDQAGSGKRGWRRVRTVVAAIVLVLGAVVAAIPISIVSMALLRRPDPDRVKWDQALNDMMELSNVASICALETDGEYPASLAVVAPKLGKPMPVDPFTGAEFVYVRTTSGFELRWLGRDGAPGGKGADEDIMVNERGYRRPP